MSFDKETQKWLTDFQGFLKSDEVAPPRAVSQRVLSNVRIDLNPPLRQVTAKLFGLHVLAAGILTLFCPQLGVGPIVGGHGIMHLFMHYGPLPCAAICGALFMGGSALLASLVLKREELRLANRNGFLYMSFLAAVSFAGLMLAGGEGDRLIYLFWILGAILSGWTILKTGATLRLGRRQLIGM